MRRLVAVLAAVFLVFGLAPTGARAYHLWDHNNVTADALEVPALAGAPELVAHAADIAAGAVHEDQHDHVYDLTCNLIPAPWEVPWCWCTHFWDADGFHGNGPGGPYDADKCPWPLGSEDCYPNAYQKALALFEQALSAYRGGDAATAYERLGHVAHLLADMTVPAHAHEDYANDNEGHDDYEAWVKSTAGHPGVAIPSAPAALLSTDAIRARLTDLSRSGIGAIPAGMVTWPDRALKVYYLFYTANQRADYFDSPDYGGDSVEPYGWVDYSTFPTTAGGASDRMPAFTTMANHLWSYAVAATASLYRLFLDEVGRFAPTITSFGPGQGPAGTVVTISGTGFTDVVEVRVGGVLVPFTPVSPTTIRATLPAGVQSGPVTVTVPGGTATSAGDFAVTFAPSVVSFSPLSGKVGTAVTIGGTGLGQARGVTIGGVTAAFTVRSPTMIVATVPAGAKTGPVRVITQYGTATSARSFYVMP